MHVCTECGKKYQSQNSLNRHARNHRGVKPHTCQTCGVAFGRKDLLSRHSAIHESVTSLRADGSATTTTPDLTSRPRKRCHTACTRCATLRRRCDGQSPCQACLHAGVLCEFSRRSSRLSQARSGHNEDPELLPISWPDAEALSLPLSSSETQATTQQQTQVFLPEVADPAPVVARHQGHEVVTPEIGTIDLDFDIPIEGLMSWPWVHESLYLPLQESATPTLPGLAMLTSLSKPCAPALPTGDIDLSTAPSTPRQIQSSLQGFPSPCHPENPHEVLGHEHPTGTYVEDLGSRNRVINELLTYAAMTHLPTALTSNHALFWSSMSPKVDAAFHLQSSDPCNCLIDLVSLYLQHFGILWPLLTRQNLDINTLHPLLCLVLTSIGGMYGGAGGTSYGTMMHDRVRTYLTVAFELDEDNGDFTWLAQARLLTQVASLYFGQPKAFTYSQHLGALLVAQGRRMGLFATGVHKTSMKHYQRLKATNRYAERLSIWIQMEARRRLAFGIFRGDVFTSVLLDTKPLLSLQEIELEFPTCDAVWRAEAMSAQACLHMIEHDRTPGRYMRASDIYLVALDPSEALPPLDPGAHELLLFGLQRPLWQFSHDQSLFERLTGSDVSSRGVLPRPTAQSGGASTSCIASESEKLESSYRRMSKVASDYENLMKALEKWEKSLLWVKTFSSGDHDRSGLLSGLVLFHLAHLRLCCPIGDIHDVQYQLIKGQMADPDLAASLNRWGNTSQAKLAAERAINIWSLIKEETDHQQSTGIRFNLLAFIGLYHSAAALWCYANVRQSVTGHNSTIVALTLRESSNVNIPVTRENSRQFLDSFIDLFHKISPGGWSSFAEAIAKLASQEFPITS